MALLFRTFIFLDLGCRQLRKRILDSCGFLFLPVGQFTEQFHETTRKEGECTNEHAAPNAKEGSSQCCGQLDKSFKFIALC